MGCAAALLSGVECALISDCEDPSALLYRVWRGGSHCNGDALQASRALFESSPEAPWRSAKTQWIVTCPRWARGS